MQSPPPQYHQCLSHPGVPAAGPCAHCGRPFCQNCLVEMTGQRLCGWCRNVRLQQMQGGYYRPGYSTTDPRQVVLWARIYSGFMILLTGTGAFLTGGYSALMGFAGRTAPASASSPPPPAAVFDTIAGVGIAIAAGMFVIGLFTFGPPVLGPAPGRGWYWTWQLVAIILGLISSICSYWCGWLFGVAPSIVLMIFWCKPEVRTYCDAVANGRVA